MPFAIGRGLQEGVADEDLSAAAELVGRRPRARRRSRRCPACCGTGSRSTTGCARPSARCSCSAGTARRSGSRSARKLPTGEVVAAATNDALHIGSAFDITARLAGAVISYVVVARHPAGHLGPPRAGRPARRARLVLVMGPVLRPLQRRQHVQREVAGKLTALGADTVAGLRVLRGIGGEPAFLDRYRRRSEELRQAGLHVAARQATAGRRPGAAARGLPRRRHLAERPAGAGGHDRRRRPRRVLRLRLLPGHPDPYGGRGGRQGDPVAGRRPAHRRRPADRARRSATRPGRRPSHRPARSCTTPGPASRPARAGSPRWSPPTPTSPRRWPTGSAGSAATTTG